MAPKNRTTTESKDVPFGAMTRPGESDQAGESSQARGGAGTTAASSEGAEGSSDGGDRDGAEGPGRRDYRKQEKRRGNSRRGGRRRRKKKSGEGQGEGSGSESGARQQESGGNRSNGQVAERGSRRSRKKRGRSSDRLDRSAGGRSPEAPTTPAAPAIIDSGMFISEKGGFGTLRRLENQYLPSKKDIFVPQRLIQRYKLSDGALVEGPISRGKKHKFQLDDVKTLDGRPPKELDQVRGFKSLVTIDPDFHYCVGDITDNASMRILDILAPVGRGQRGLIVAAPRTGKTTLLRQFAKGIELGFPEVHLMVLLVDERPEEATEWVRSTAGQVFVSTSDETPKNHVQLAEAVWKRCQRLVELGEDVVLILDSITRLARAYNNHTGGSGRTMSGGLDSRAMERPRQIFGSARNTETAGSLTILGTTLVDTGSRMDQMIFEEFKGTGNMEVALNRKLADRRIFPAIDIEKSGTRKEEKLIGSRKLKWISTLRRVLLKMNFIEAMELLVEKLENVEKTEDFLQRFDVDPEA